MPHSDFILLIYMASLDLLHGFHVLLGTPFGYLHVKVEKDFGMYSYVSLQMVLANKDSTTNFTDEL